MYNYLNHPRENHSGVWVKVSSASGRVWVSPRILNTKVMVAPNSPRQRAKFRITPVMIPGVINGRVMVKKMRPRMVLQGTEIQIMDPFFGYKIQNQALYHFRMREDFLV